MFDVHITDLIGNELCRAEEFTNTSVEIPLNDGRTAKTTLSVYADQATINNIQPGNRMLKIWYNKHLVFWGRIGKPIWDAANGTVEVNAIDSSIMYKHKYHRYGNMPVDRGYYMDGYGFWTLMESAEPMQTQVARGIVGPGVYRGLDYTTYTIHGANPVPIITDQYGDGSPNEGQGWFRKVARGMNVWQSMTDLAKYTMSAKVYQSGFTLPGLFGFDFEFQPVDALNPPTYNIYGAGGAGPTYTKTWKPGYFAQVNLHDRQGTDKRSTVVWHCGWGKHNAANVVYEPDLDQMRNYAVAVPPGGPANRLDAKRRGLAHLEASWLKYGIFGEWIATNSQYDAVGVLRSRAQYEVYTYGLPPEFFTVSPQREFYQTGGAPVEKTDMYPYRYIDDFIVGDVIHVSVKKGNYKKELDGRIIKVTLQQVDGDKNVAVSIDCVPPVAVNVTGGSGDEAH